MFRLAFDRMGTARDKDSEVLFRQLNQISTDMFRNAMDKVGILLGNLDATKTEDQLGVDKKKELKKNVKFIVLEWTELWRRQKKSIPPPDNDIPDVYMEDVEDEKKDDANVSDMDVDDSSGSDSDSDSD